MDSVQLSKFMYGTGEYDYPEVVLADDSLTAGYSPSQPRDSVGRWKDTGIIQRSDDGRAIVNEGDGLPPGMTLKEVVIPEGCTMMQSGDVVHVLPQNITFRHNLETGESEMFIRSYVDRKEVLTPYSKPDGRLLTVEDVMGGPLPDEAPLAVFDAATYSPSGLPPDDRLYGDFGNTRVFSEYSAAEQAQAAADLSPQAQAALEAYTRTGQLSQYKRVNSLLRHGPSEISTGREEGIINGMDEVFDKSHAVEEPILVWRGGSGSISEPGKLPVHIRDLPAGTVVTDAGFLSTSVDKATAETFGSLGLISIEVPKGVHIVRGQSSEYEVILDRGTVLESLGNGRFRAVARARKEAKRERR
jgi:hypothetical protein